jgi:hypothetical protein
MQFIVKFRSEILIYRKFDNYNSSRCTGKTPNYLDSISSFMPLSQLSRRKRGRATAISNLPAISTAMERRSVNDCMCAGYGGSESMYKGESKPHTGSGIPHARHSH